MAAFFTGLVIALALMIGSIVLYSTSEVTSVQHSSPTASVRLDDAAPQTAAGDSQGTPQAHRASAQ